MILLAVAVGKAESQDDMDLGNHDSNSLRVDSVASPGRGCSVYLELNS